MCDRTIRITAIAIVAAAMAFALGCSEWNDYWRPDRHGAPAPAPDITAPEIRILTPSGADSLHPTPVSGSAFAIEADARDDREVARVNLFLDGVESAVMVDRPFRWTWDTTAQSEASIHRVWALATDTAGNSASSDTVYAVVFNAGPHVTITAPVAGAYVHGQVELVAEPDDPRIPIDHVDFMANGATVGTASAVPFRLDWDSETAAPGTVFLSALAVGDNGAISVSPVVAVPVNNFPPVVAIRFPDSGHVIARLGTMPFSASAQDTVHGAIGDSLVWISDLDGELGRGADLTRSRMSTGTHTITAQATNAWGLTGSAQVTLIVHAQPTYTWCDSMFYNLIIEKCHGCHFDGSEFWPQHQFTMDSWNGMMAGGLHAATNPSIVPCKPESSLVYQKIMGDVTPPPIGQRMPLPPFAPLESWNIEKFRVWISEGAPPTEGYESGCP